MHALRFSPGHPYLSGDMLAARLDPEGLGLAPLKLEEWGVWDPGDQDCFDDDHELEAWARPIVARGPRPDFEMETCMPGLDPEDFDSDPIHDAVHLRRSGDPVGAIQLLLAVRPDLERGQPCSDTGGREASRPGRARPMSSLSWPEQRRIRAGISISSWMIVKQRRLDHAFRA